MKKKNFGVFSFTCCEGCVMTFLEYLNDKFFELNEKIEFKYFRLLKQKNELKKLDVALVEGAISSKEELNELKEIRKKSKIVIALGSGAINGWPSNARNSFSQKQLQEIQSRLKPFNAFEKVSSINKFIKVDFIVNGCPIDLKELDKTLELVLKE